MQEWQGQLLPGERLAWTGSAGRGLVLTRNDAFLVPFSLFFFGFSLFWISMASQAPGQTWMVGLLFVAVGAYIAIGRFFVDAYLRTNTRYAVTDRRVLIARDGIGAAFTAVDISQLPSLTLQPRRDGRGTIRFGASGDLWSRSGSRYNGLLMPSTDPVPQFIAIDNAQTVFDLIQRHQQKLSEK